MARKVFVRPLPDIRFEHLRAGDWVQLRAGCGDWAIVIGRVVEEVNAARVSVAWPNGETMEEYRSELWKMPSGPLDDVHASTIGQPDPGAQVPR